MKEKILWGIAVVGVLLGVIAVVSNPRSASIFGAAGNMLAENYIPYVMYNDGYKSENGIVLSGADGDLTVGDDLVVSGDVTIGASGSAVAQVIKGIGSIVGNAPVTASTTKAFDIAVTGAVSGDICFAQGASTTQSYLGMEIIGCSASSTSGFITLLVSNPNAAAVVPYPIASATQYMIIR